jgi:hypothetical protein
MSVGSCFIAVIHSVFKSVQYVFAVLVNSSVVVEYGPEQVSVWIAVSIQSIDLCFIEGSTQTNTCVNRDACFLLVEADVVQGEP